MPAFCPRLRPALWSYPKCTFTHQSLSLQKIGILFSIIPQSQKFCPQEVTHLVSWWKDHLRLSPLAPRSFIDLICGTQFDPFLKKNVSHDHSNQCVGMDNHKTKPKIYWRDLTNKCKGNFDKCDLFLADTHRSTCDHSKNPGWIDQRENDNKTYNLWKNEGWIVFLSYPFSSLFYWISDVSAEKSDSHRSRSRFRLSDFKSDVSDVRFAKSDVWRLGW